MKLKKKYLRKLYLFTLKTPYVTLLLIAAISAVLLISANIYMTH